MSMISHPPGIVKRIGDILPSISDPIMAHGQWRLVATVVLLGVEEDEPCVLTVEGHLPSTELAPSNLVLEDALRAWFLARVGVAPGSLIQLPLRSRGPEELQWIVVGLVRRLVSNATGAGALGVYEVLPELDTRRTHSRTNTLLTAEERRLLAEALTAVRARVDTEPILAPLLDDAFTLPALVQRTEAIVGRYLHAPNTRRRLVERGIVEPVGLRIRQGHGRPAELWRLVGFASLSHDETN